MSGCRVEDPGGLTGQAGGPNRQGHQRPSSKSSNLPFQRWSLGVTEDTCATSTDITYEECAENWGVRGMV